MVIEIAAAPLLGVLALLWLPAFIPYDLRRRLTDPTRLSFPTFRGMVRVWSNWLDLLRGAAGAYLLATAVFFPSSGETGKPSDGSKPDQRSASVTNKAGDMSKTNAMAASAGSETGERRTTNPISLKWPHPQDKNKAKMDGSGGGTSVAGKGSQAKAMPLKVALMQLAVMGVGLLIQTVRLRRDVTLKVTVFAPIFYACGITLAQSDLLIGAAGVGVGWLISLAAKSPIYQLPVMGAALGVAGFLVGSLSLMMFAGVVFLPIIVGLLWQKRLVYISHGRSAAHKG